MKTVNTGSAESILWPDVYTSLDNKGFALIKKVLLEEECKEFILMYTKHELFRNVVNMKRYRFGYGEYKYFNYALPHKLQFLRETLYTPLTSLANTWMNMLGMTTTFPSQHNSLIEHCKQKGQTRPTPLILKYEQGGFNTLHQDLYGEVYFPFQVVFVLTQSGRDHEGGELVFTEQIPRAQSKATIVKPDQGDAIIFTTNFRPMRGTRGYYKATMKHGVSEVTSGVRYALGLIFHDAV